MGKRRANSGILNEFHLAHVAQLVEHVLGKDEVTGSIPVMGSSLRGAKFATFKPTKHTKHNG